MPSIPRPFRALVDEPLVRAARRVARGRACHLVGGVLRDRYLGLQSQDLDLVVAGDGLSFATDLGSHLGARLVVLGGDRFSAYRLVSPDLTIDVWDRADSSIRQDLERRDFTINALALDVAGGTLHDPFGGLLDLERRRLRAVQERSIEEDPLRALRLVRFRLLLPDFSVDESTTSLARAAARAVPSTAAERRREELARITRDAAAAQALDALSEVGLFPLLWSDDRSLSSRIPALRRSLALCDGVARTVDRSLSRTHCFHALIGKAIGTAREDAAPVSEASKSVPRFADSAGLVTKRQLRAVTRLLEATDGDLSLSPRQFLARWGALWLEASMVAWAATRDGSLDRAGEWIRALGRLVDSEGDEVLAPRPLLDGREIGALLDLPPGPAIGRLLELLVEAQIQGEIRTREEAIRRLGDLMRNAAR